MEGGPFGKPPALGVALSSCDRTLFIIGIDKKNIYAILTKINLFKNMKGVKGKWFPQG